MGHGMILDVSTAIGQLNAKLRPVLCTKASHSRATGRNFAFNCPMAVETSRIMPCIGHCRAAVRSAGRSVNLPTPNPTSWRRMIARRRTRASEALWDEGVLGAGDEGVI